jgi:hypothetical protein
MQALAHAWAQAAVAAGWSPPYPSPPLSSGTVAASHLQYDELEMMHLGSMTAPSEREKRWVGSLKVVLRDDFVSMVVVFMWWWWCVFGGGGGGWVGLQIQLLGRLSH